MSKTYIFGHKKPDTDSVMSAIGLSYLKNHYGKNTEPRVLGNINKETKYALSYFNLKEPQYLNDVKLQLKDIDYHKNFYLKETDSIYNGYQAMLEEGLTGLPVVNTKGYFTGLVTIKDLSHTIVNENAEDLYTSYDNLLQVLKGEALVRNDEEIIGRILVAAYRSTTFMETVKLERDMVLIVGDRHSIIEYAVNSGVKLIILAGDADIHETHLEIARQNHVNIIRTPYTSYHITRLVSLANYIKTLLRCYNPTKFENTEFVDNVVDINNKLKHTNYPIVDKNNKCLGLLKITDLSEKHPKKVILVDHNETMQSADGIEEAEILEIIDHHNLGSITTKSPINFTNMAVGSTCTIVYTMYKDRGLELPKEIAGALLSGILSDTLILRSPTTTELDRIAVKELAKISSVNYQEYGMNLLKAGTSLEGMTKEDVLYNDFKVYTVNGKSFALGQFFTMSFDEIEKDLDDYVHVLNEVSESNHYALLALYVTDIVRNGSYIIFNTKGKDLLEVAYNLPNISEGEFIAGTISRKKHVVPTIMPIFES